MSLKVSLRVVFHLPCIHSSSQDPALFRLGAVHCQICCAVRGISVRGRVHYKVSPLEIVHIHCVLKFTAFSFEKLVGCLKAD